MDKTSSGSPSGDTLSEIREAYSLVGIELAETATYGLYTNLRCQKCGKMLGVVGDKLLPGMISALVARNRALYVSGLMGCDCGHQSQCARQLNNRENGGGE